MNLYINTNVNKAKSLYETRYNTFIYHIDRQYCM